MESTFGCLESTLKRFLSWVPVSDLWKHSGCRGAGVSELESRRLVEAGVKDMPAKAVLVGSKEGIVSWERPEKSKVVLVWEPGAGADASCWGPEGWIEVDAAETIEEYCSMADADC